ncbi:unnamed protein product [Adineta ricciae]|uniref:Superoxide dismutase copper/zinc binding domain-containing protein n=1 Tax=Adineta ricciae TaxID=249248 RepID=A0A815GPF6_ADIRI|nr:unnamed protein product [Adineta ricciae]CAF1654456.1 unnamed protein product [Adineta ricciae]
MTETTPTVSTKLEFLVDFNQQEQVDRLRKLLTDRKDITHIDIDPSSKRVVLDTTEQSSKIQKLIEQSLNTNAVLLGAGKSAGAAAVSALYSNINRPFERRVHGLVRFIQADDEQCIIEGTIDGLSPNSPAKINIHEYGDLSNGCDSCGDHYQPSKSSNGSNGVLGQVMTDESGTADFRLLRTHLHVPDLIGRSFVVQTSDSQRVACGIIARSAGIFENTKRLCACSGATVWQERQDVKESFQ